MPVDYLSGVGEAMEERGRRWRCADAGEHGQPGRPPLEVWTLGKECGRRRAWAPWPLAVGGSTDVDAPGPWEGWKQARGTSRSWCGRHGDG